MSILQAVTEMGQDAGNSIKAVPAAMEYLAKVAVQDALELAERSSDNPVHALLLEEPAFM